MAVPIFTPGHAFMQSTYSDQMGTALPGMLVNASDINLCDAATSYWPPAPSDNWFWAGSFTVLDFSGTKYVNDGRKGMNTIAACPVTAVPTATQSYGVIVRNGQMYTAADGMACVLHDAQCTVMRTDRVGGRVWVFCSAADKPAVGARSAYIKQFNNTYALQGSNAGGALALSGIIVHGIEQSTFTTTAAGALALALIEFST
jgi:hypothetical protein